MNSVIKYSLKRKLFSLPFIIFNLIIIVFLAFSNKINFVDDDIHYIKLDYSTHNYASYFLSLNNSDYHYLINDGPTDNNTAVLFYENGWKLKAAKLNEKILNRVEKDIHTVVNKAWLDTSQKEASDIIAAYNQQLDFRYEITETENNNYSIELLLYLIFTGYSCGLVNEVNNDRNENMLETILSVIKPKQHLNAKIIVCYLQFIIQLLITLLAGCFLLNVQTEIHLEKGIDSIVIYGLMLLTNILMVQLILLAVSLLLKNHEEINMLQSLFNILIFGLFMALLTGNLHFNFSVIYRYLPITSIYLFGKDITEGTVDNYYLLLSCLASGGCCYLIYQAVAFEYDKLILNYGFNLKRKK